MQVEGKPNAAGATAKTSFDLKSNAGISTDTSLPTPAIQAKPASSLKIEGRHDQSKMTMAGISNRDGAISPLFIGIAGMIGAGKSTLAKALSEHLEIDAYYEPVADNEYLEDFYKETAKYSFAMQVYLLNRRFQQHQEIIWRGRSAVQDRTIYEDSIFAKMLADAGLMDPRDYQTYLQLFRHMSNFMCKPSMIVYLDVSPESSMNRIEMRSRGVESGIKLEYLKGLYEGYEDFVKDISRTIPVIRVDYERFATAEEMAEVIKREYLEHSFLREVARV